MRRFRLPNKAILGSALAGAGATTIAPNCLGADTHWVGGDGAWHDPSRWSGGSAPAPSDRAILGAPVASTIGCAPFFECGQVFVASGSARLLLAEQESLAHGLPVPTSSAAFSVIVHPETTASAELRIEGGRLACPGFVSAWSLENRGGASLSILGGARVSARGLSTVGWSPPALAEIRLEGQGTHVSLSDHTTIGGQGVGALYVTDHAVLQAAQSFDLAGHAQIAGGSATVVVDEHAVLSTGPMVIGEFGPATVEVRGGSSLQTAAATLGFYSAGGSNVRGDVLVTGAGSAWTNTGIIAIGAQNTGAGTGYGRIRIEDGACLMTGGLNLQGWPYQGQAIQGAEVYVDGVDSRLTCHGALNIGTVSGPLTGRLTASSAALVEAGRVAVGSSLGLGRLTLQSGARLLAAGELAVADDGIGDLAVTGGASLVCQSAVMGRRTPATNQAGPTLVVVSGSGSSVEVSGPALIGVGRQATVSVAEGATLRTGSVEAGRAPGGLCSIVLTGGAAWLNDGHIAFGLALGTQPPGQVSSLVLVGNSLVQSDSIDVGANAFVSAPSVALGQPPALTSGLRARRLSGVLGATIGAPLMSISPGGEAHGELAVSGMLGNGGVLSPGGPIGRMTIGGAFTQTSHGALHIDIGGRDAGTWDRVQAAQTASLAGTLRVQLRDGFAPVRGDEFQILSAQSVSGAFETLEFPALADPSHRWWWAIRQNECVVGVRHVADANRDGGVDFADLMLVLATYGATGTAVPLPGDVNEDGRVNFLDLSIVLGYFGQ